MKKLFYKQQGFTLVEVMVSSFIIVLLGVTITSIIYIVNQNQLVVFTQYLNIDEANENVQLLVKELRTARDGDNGAFVLKDASDQTIEFYSDIDFDGVTEKVRYYLNGNSLYKGVIKATGYPVTYPVSSEKIKLLANNVKNGQTPLFYYYNDNWPQDSTNNPLTFSKRLADTKLIRIYLKTNTANDPKSDYVSESYTQIRILKDNL